MVDQRAQATAERLRRNDRGPGVADDVASDPPASDAPSFSLSPREPSNESLRSSGKTDGLANRPAESAAMPMGQAEVERAPKSKPRRTPSALATAEPKSEYSDSSDLDSPPAGPTDAPASRVFRRPQVWSKSEILAYPPTWSGGSEALGKDTYDGRMAVGGKRRGRKQREQGQLKSDNLRQSTVGSAPAGQPDQAIVLGDIPATGRTFGTYRGERESNRRPSDISASTERPSRSTREEKVADALGMVVDGNDITVLNGSGIGGLGGQVAGGRQAEAAQRSSLPQPVQLPRRAEQAELAQLERLSSLRAVDPQAMLQRAEVQMRRGDVAAARRSLEDLSGQMGWESEEGGKIVEQLRENRDMSEATIDDDRLRASARGLERQLDLALRSGAVEEEMQQFEAVETMDEAYENLNSQDGYFMMPVPVVEPGQTLALSLHESDEKGLAEEYGAWQFEVSSSGWAEVPGVGPMRVSGLTAEQVAQRVARAHGEGTEASAIIVDAIRDAQADTAKAVEKPRASTARVATQLPTSREVQRQAAEELPPARAFKLTPPNPWVLTERDRQSTFALDVDTASYALCRRYIRSGYLPPRGAVRMEEFINYFDYNYPDQADRTFAVHIQATDNPFDRPGERTTLLKVGVKGKVIGRAGRKAAHLVFVVDTSGSMARADRLPLVVRSLAMLLGELDSGDRISLVTYGQEARLLLDGVPADNPAPIRQVLENLQTGGSTNLLQGLGLGYRIAARRFQSGQINRVILCSDGVANLGETESQAMLDQVDQYRRQGIACTTVGFGHGAYNDALMEDLANKGDGSYLFIDSAGEARRVFVEQMAATLQTVAADAKIQVEFNPLRVRRYRLIGYENRDIADEDFRNDSVDAGEVGSGQSSTALYELELIGGPADRAWTDLGTVYVRYRDVDTGKIQEIARRIESGHFEKLTVKQAPRFYLAAAAAKFAEVLRGSPYASHVNLPQVRRVIEEVAVALPLDQRVAELADLVRAADGLPPAP
jgi:Ca-activated chloride channel family protein